MAVELSNELVAKLKKAKSHDEVASILKAEGMTDADSALLWKELEKMHEGEGKELSLDELDAVAGGVKHRDWLDDGCAATVEYGSDCWRTDGGCTYINIKYSREPHKTEKCPECGGPVFYWDTWGSANKTCPKHGTWHQSWYETGRPWRKVQ